MKKLNRIKLDFQATFEFIKWNLEDLNELSRQLLNNIDFKNGSFFTLLPNDGNLQKLYDFKSAGILPSNPIKEHFINGKKATYSLIPTIQNELSDYILSKMQKNKKLSCILDDYNSSPKDSWLGSFELFHLIYVYKAELYYLINNTQAKFEWVLQCLENSNIIWHSLCILTEADLKHVKNNKLTLDDMREICNKSKLIIVGAYDGEGYVLWEKQ